MDFLLPGAAVAVLVIVAVWVFWGSHRRERPQQTDGLLLQVMARHKPEGWINILVTITNCAPADLYVHAIRLVEPRLGEFIAAPRPDTPGSGREITVDRHLPSCVDGMDFPSTSVELLLDDPSNLIGEIGLAVTVSRPADGNEPLVLSGHSRVWVSPQ